AKKCSASRVKRVFHPGCCLSLCAVRVLPSMSSTTDSIVTEAHRQKYIDDGFFVLQRVIPPAQLQMLRDEAAMFVAKVHAEMDAAGTDTLGTDIRDNRYFIANRYKESDRLAGFLFSDLMADICRATIGPDAFL